MSALSELQEEVLCWTIGCFVFAAIAFAAWTRHAAARMKQRRLPRSGSFTKRRRRRKPRH